MAQAVNVMDIVDSRSQEITAAMEALKTNMSVSYKLSIPFYMRRRAASHNPKRLPARVRPPDAERSKTKFKWKKRKGRRQEEESGIEGEKEEEGEMKGKRKEEVVRMEDTSKKEADAVKKAERLETHLWHAKRCHMSDLWGYRLALRTTQKGARATHRAVYTATTLQDTSFYTWVAVSGEAVHSKLSGVLVPNHVTLDRVTCSHLYTGTVCVGPVLVYWVCENVVFVRLHPAITHCYTDVSSLFPPDLTISSHSFSSYTLHGVRSLELLVKSLSLSDSTCTEVREIWNTLSDNPYHYDVMSGTVLGCSVLVPPRQHKIFTSVINSDIKQPAHRLCPGRELDGGLLFRSVLSDSQLGTLVPDKDCVMEVAEPDQQLNTEKLHSESSVNTNTQNTKMKTDEESGTLETVRCCIYKDPVTSSLTLLLPRGTGTRFWIPLVYSGGRVIGLQDSHSLNTDRSIPTFPADYPDTEAGRRHVEEEGREKEGKEQRRPPQKRVRYEELGISAPWIPDWSAVTGVDTVLVIRDPGLLSRVGTLSADLDKHLLTVSVSCVGRGNLRLGAHLYFHPDQTEPRDLTKSREECTTRDPVYSAGDKYALVGYITSAQYNLNTGRGAGIGMLLCGVYKELLVSGRLLVRNTTSKQYRPVQATLVR